MYVHLPLRLVHTQDISTSKTVCGVPKTFVRSAPQIALRVVTRAGSAHVAHQFSGFAMDEAMALSRPLVAPQFDSEPGCLVATARGLELGALEPTAFDPLMVKERKRGGNQPPSAQIQTARAPTQVAATKAPDTGLRWHGRAGILRTAPVSVPAHPCQPREPQSGSS